MSFNIGEGQGQKPSGPKINLPYLLVGLVLFVGAMYLYFADNIPNGLDGGLAYILRAAALVAGGYLLVRGVFPKNRAKKAKSTNISKF